MRGCGILLPVSSLPGREGIGSLGPEAYEFIDFLAAAGQGSWQVLPHTPPARGNSPYSAVSVFAGNPYFISIQLLEEQGLLESGTAQQLPGNSGRVDYRWCGQKKLALLRGAFREERRSCRWKDQIARFRRKNRFWLEDYAVFMALKGKQGHNIPFQQWPEKLAFRDAGALEGAKTELAGETDFWIFVQYLFFSQWKNLKEYAREKGIALIGDLPIYTDSDSAEVWANPREFQLDDRLYPRLQAGVPPDAFSAEGQLWGNPLYDWEYGKSTGWNWWMERLRVTGGLYDSLRIDHFRALDEYFAIPAEAENARDGRWMPGPGLEFVRAAKKTLGSCSLIAEDLGILTDSVRELLKKSGLPGMKVLLFAFDPTDQSDYLPHNFIRHCVGYIGTHDNDTVQGWMGSAPREQVRFARRYLKLSAREGYHWGFIRGLYGTVADTVVVQMQDVLGLDDSARMNIPATPEGNWAWRMPESSLTPALSAKLRELARRYGRA